MLEDAQSAYPDAHEGQWWLPPALVVTAPAPLN